MEEQWLLACSAATASSKLHHTHDQPQAQAIVFIRNKPPLSLGASHRNHHTHVGTGGRHRAQTQATVIPHTYHPCGSGVGGGRWAVGDGRWAGADDGTPECVPGYSQGGEQRHGDVTQIALPVHDQDVGHSHGTRGLGIGLPSRQPLHLSILRRNLEKERDRERERKSLAHTRAWARTPRDNICISAHGW